MEEKVLKTIKKYNLIQDNDKLVLAVSGGPDSLSMLNVLNEIKNKQKLKFDFVVAHVNHMLRKESEEEEKFVKNFCEKIKVKCYIKRIDVKNYAYNKKIGTEEAARILRYNFFDEVLKGEKANKIVIAHNRNDRVETIIMNILRGTGLSGLKGIEPIRNEKIIRPLIEIDRQEVDEYCDRFSLDPRIDETNFENIYTRNKVRNIVIPYIKKEFNPNIIETIIRLSDVIVEEDEFLNNITEQIYKSILIEQKEKMLVLNLKEFNKQDDVIKSRIILYTIRELRGTSKGIEKVHITDIIKLCNNNIGNKFLTPNKNLKVLIKNKKIYFIALN